MALCKNFLIPQYYYHCACTYKHNRLTLFAAKCVAFGANVWSILLEIAGVPLGVIAIGQAEHSIRG